MKLITKKRSLWLLRHTIQVLLSLAANLDWILQQLDVENVFLNGDLEKKSLYGV